MEVEAKTHSYVHQPLAVLLYHSLRFIMLPESTPVLGLVPGPGPPKSSETSEGVGAGMDIGKDHVM